MHTDNFMISLRVGTAPAQLAAPTHAGSREQQQDSDTAFCLQAGCCFQDPQGQFHTPHQKAFAILVSPMIQIAHMVRSVPHHEEGMKLIYFKSFLFHVASAKQPAARSSGFTRGKQPHL